MTALLKILYESVAQAMQQLTSNRLRSFLSLFGISIGIFCIIGIAAAIDSLEYNIRKSFEQLGDDVVFVQKISWGQDPGRNYLKYMRRPNITYDDYEVIKTKAQTASTVVYSVFVGNKTLKYRSNNLEDVFVRAVTHGFAELYQVKFDKGRYFSLAEANYGTPKVVIGYKVAESLFGPLDPIGKSIKMSGRKMEVIGVIEEMGEGIGNPISYDDEILISYEFAKKVANLKSKSVFGNSSVDVKAAAGITNAQLKDELTGILRSSRRLRPRENNNFSLNELSIFAKVLDQIFSVISKMGASIGIFAILVGAFGIANIMFVSVKERTRLIGIKKALGAKNFMILAEFLVEAIILCILGGLIGLGLVYLLVLALSNMIDFDFRLSQENIIWGIGCSVFVGMVAGFVPALRAARLDPVVAMRG